MAYETTLDDWQKPEREDEGYGWPDHSVQPNRRVGPEFLDKYHEGGPQAGSSNSRSKHMKSLGKRIAASCHRRPASFLVSRETPKY